MSLSSAFFRLRVEGRTGPLNKTAVIFQSLVLHQFNARPFGIGVLSPHNKSRRVHFKHLVHKSGRNLRLWHIPWMYGSLSVYNKSLYCLSVSHGCIVLWVFTSKSLLPFCVSIDVLCSGCFHQSLYCLSVSAWMYCALGVYIQVITAFLCQQGCIVLCVHSQVFTAFLCQHECIVLWVFTTKSLLPFCVSMDVLCSVFTAKSLMPFCVSMDALCSVFKAKSLLPFCVSMGVSCSVFTAKSLLPFCVSMVVSCSVFTAKSLLPFCVSMDISCSGYSQPSHNCLSVSAWMYCALGVHSIVITAFPCQHGCIVLWVFTA
ncbi:hypothetical protein DPMN_019086 [Dreissena polymorpha]|uniref:Uncharacterized protein n=1 Tax=Dreissena polymorpha TaxID=45954 RepID=A0A9D4NIJ2_DREPO|nr:hypothetical protein DPMN_019086 [Dreissena polymorpha]